MNNNFYGDLESVFTRFQSIHYRQGEIVLRPEDVPQGVYYVKKGYVRLFNVSQSGTEITLHIFPPDSCFPLLWALHDHENKLYFEALTDLMVYRAPKLEVVNFIKDNSEVCFKLMSEEVMTMHNLEKRAESLIFGSAYIKVVSAVVYLAIVFGVKANGKTYINHWFTHQDIAAIAGVVRETASIELERLKKEGLISYIKRAIVISNIEDLEALIV